MTVNILIQVDKLVQLIESPVFTCMCPNASRAIQTRTNVWQDLRLQLLEPEKYPFLYKCMYGILMLLPQSSAFAALKNRLNSVSSIGYLHVAPKRYACRPFTCPPSIAVPSFSHCLPNENSCMLQAAYDLQAS